MRKFSIFIMPLLCISCQTQMAPDETDKHIPNDPSAYFVTENAALQISESFWGTTRNSANYSTSKIKDDSTKETLAYVINRGDNGGWVIIAADSRAQKILAYSENGSFKCAEDIENPLYSEFIAQLPVYFNEIRSEYKTEESGVSATLYYSKIVPEKLSPGYWHQHEPWNKYVKDSLYRNDPQFTQGDQVAVGCVALATSLIMANCKHNLLYNGINFDFDYMLQCIKDSIVAPTLPPIVGPITPAFPFSSNQINGTNQPYISRYDNGVDIMARLLLHVGRDINTNYMPNNGSTASSSNSIMLLKRLGYNVKNQGSNSLFSYDPEAMVNHLHNNRIIYISGKWNGKTYPNGSYENVSLDVGHAWLIDGCHYSVASDDPMETPQFIYFHHEWCEENASSGYYSADVMQILVSQRLLHMDLDSFRYFAVTIEK